MAQSSFVIDNFPVALARIDKNLKLLSHNRLLSNLLMFDGRAPNPIDTDFCELSTEANKLRTSLNAFVASDASEFFAKFELMPNGRDCRFVNANFSKNIEEDGAVVIYCALNLDLEDEKFGHLSDKNPLARGARKTKKKLEQLYHVMEATNSTIWEYDYGAKSIDLENGFFKLLRLESSPSKDLLDYLKLIVHPNDESVLSEAISALNLDNEIHSFTARFRDNDGNWRWLQVSGRIVERQKNGLPKLAQGIVLDITRQKNLEIELHESASNLAAVSALSGTHSWEVDLFSGLMNWSNNAHELFEAAPNYKIRNIEEFLAAFFEKEAAECLRQAIDNVLFSHEEFKFELPIKTAKGNAKWVEFFGFPHLENGHVAYLMGAFRDISEKIENANILADAVIAAKQASETKSQFLANMSHEIRTPLNGVLGVASALERTNLDINQRNMVDIILNSGRALGALLNDILDISKIEAGQFSLDVIDAKASEIVTNCCAIFENSAKEKGLDLVVKNHIPENAIIKVDPIRVRQILSNLLSNAVKFTSQGSVEVEAHLEPIGTYKTAKLSLKVKDTGTGFTEEVKNRLFGRFVQADSSISRNFGGTGLGLSICRSLAQMMKGEVDCASEPDIGSTFWFSALVECDFLHHADEIKEETYDEDFDKDVKILAAEDNRVNQAVLKMLLNEFPFEIEFANNGQEAVDAYRTKTYDIVLMDTQMPIMDGLEATRKIREIELIEQKPRIPIITLSANVMPEQLKEASEAGADDYVAKPIDARELFTKIAKWLNTNDGEVEREASKYAQ